MVTDINNLFNNESLQYEFIKVFNCYTSTINSFKERFLNNEITNFDDIYFNQLKACKNIHNNWILKYQFNQSEEIITMFYNTSSLLSKMVEEYLENVLMEINFIR